MQVSPRAQKTLLGRVREKEVKHVCMRSPENQFSLAQNPISMYLNNAKSEGNIESSKAVFSDAN